VLSARAHRNLRGGELTDSRRNQQTLGEIDENHQTFGCGQLGPDGLQARIGSVDSNCRIKVLGFADRS
jgi:hypothetical protein